MARRIGLVFAAALLFACGREGAPPARLLVAAPMTGDMAADGQGLERAVRMAVEDEMKAGGLPAVEVVVADDQADPAAAAAVASRAVEDPAVFAVIGHHTSGCSIAASRVYARAPLAMITPSATAPQLTLQQERPDWVGERVVFRLLPPDTVQGKVAAEYAVQRLSLRRFVLVHDGTPYGLGLAEAFRDTLERKDGTTLAFKAVARGDRDFGAAVRTILADRPDAVFFGGLYMEAGLLIKQARAAGYRGAFISGDGAKTVDFFEIAGAAADGAYVTVGGVPVEALPSATVFVERYQKRWQGAAPQTFDHYGYEAARVALNALRKTGSDRKKVLAALRDTHVHAMVGDIIFDAKGDTLKSLVTVTKADYARRRFEVAY